MDVIREVVEPSLAELELRYQAREGAVHLGFTGETGAHDVFIHQVANPPLLFLRFQPHMFLEPGRDDALIATVLGGNYHRWFCKAARDPRDGELVFDAEIPLFAPLNQAAFIALFMLAEKQVEDMLACLAKVRWAGVQPAEALGMRAIAQDNSPEEPPTSEPVPPSELERIVAELIEQIERPKDDR